MARGNMGVELSTTEQALLEHAMAGVARYNMQRHARGGIDTLYAFLVTTEGNYYDGAAYEPNLAHATVCGERHAIANLVMNEGYGSKVASVVVADPVPTEQERGTPPCGTCRHLIWQFSTPHTSVILVQYMQRPIDDATLAWTFPCVEKHLIRDLYPYPYEPNADLWKR